MPRRTDAGVTLVELMVSSAIFSVVLLTFSTGMTMMFRSSGSVEALDVVQSGYRLATQRLDKDLGFATAVGTPAQVSADAGNWHVMVATGGACLELRLNAAAGTLERRNPALGVTWSTLATGVTADPAGPPFTRVSGDGSGHQQLGLRLRLAAGGTRDDTQRTRTTVFTAMNSSIDSVVPAGCPVAP